MRNNKTIFNKYSKIILLLVVSIISILSIYLVSNANNKVFNANIINQKASNTNREVVNIPDQELKNFLLKYLKMSDIDRKNYENIYYLKLSDGRYKKPDSENEIYKDEMEKIVEINGEVINTKLAPMDLTGLEKATNIISLKLPYNKIENIELLRGLNNLRTLDLSSNKLDNVDKLRPLENLRGLTSLNLSSNKIENIEPLRGLTNLRELYLSSNKIENIESLSGLTDLRELRLSSNKIENIESLNGLTNLVKLSLTDNKIENIEPLRGLINLESLALYTNKIVNIDSLRGLTNLTWLSLNENQVESIEPLTNLTNLTWLSLYKNKIESVEPLRRLTKITSLNIGYNKIENIDSLSGMTKLWDLHFYVNKIENIDVLSGMVNLKNLNIYNNNITNIDPILGLTKIKEFSLLNEVKIITPETDKFNLPVLKKYNGDLFDIASESNGILKKNDDGTYSFTKNVTEPQIIRVGKGIWHANPTVDRNWNNNLPIYILKIMPVNVPTEKVTITKTVKDKSDTLLNNEKETKVVPVIKRNGQVITDVNTNNIGHRANNDELLTYTWNELPKKDDTGADYNYEVTFDISGLPEGYSIEENTKTADNQADFNINYVSPNKVSETKEIPYNITYKGGDANNRPEVTVILKKKDNDTSAVTEVTRKINTANNKNSVVFENVPSKDEKGRDIEYTFEVTVPNDSNYVVENNNGNYVIKYVSPKMTFTASKEWVNGPVNKPTIKIGLLRDGNSLGDNFVKTVVTENNKTNASVAWENLDKTDENAVDYTYSISEIGEVENYQRRYEGNNKVVNTYVSPKTEVGININKNGGKATKVKVKLLKNGVEVPNTLKEATLNTKVTYTNLEKVDANGNINNYEIVVAEEVPNYVSVKDNSGNITLTYVSPKVNITVQKNWVNGETVIPETIIAKLKRKIASENTYTFVQDVTVEKNNNWTKEISNLDKTDANGNDYTYIVEEETKVDNFNASYNGLTITNTYKVPKTEITITKIWNGGKTRENVTLELKKADGTKVDEKKTTKVDENTFKAVFNNVDKTELNGNKINFKADEKETFENYVKSVNGLTVTNTYVSPKINVSKIVRIEVPKEVFKKTTKTIEVQLYKNGKPVGETKVINVDDIDENGKVVVNYKDMDKTDFDGNTLDYDVKLVKEIDGYKSKENKEKNEILIEKTIEKENKEVIVEYNGGKVKPNVVVELLQDGKVIKTETLTANAYVFKDVELNDKLGHEYKYELRIKNKKDLTNKYYEVELESNTNAKKSKITLTNVSPKTDIPVNILWQGKGKNNPTVKIQLLRNGQPMGEIVELTGKDDYIFKGLEKLDENGKEYDYKVSVIGEIPEYSYEITPNGRTIIATRNEIKAKTLPYAGLKENMPISYIVLAVLIIELVYLNKAKKNIKELENISDIKK